jgi:hypothetical protein
MILPSLLDLALFKSWSTPPPPYGPLFIRMFASGRGVLVSLLAMFVSRFGVLLRLFVLAKIMMMGGLMMMMRGRVVTSGGLMMMLTGRMLRGLCHGAVPPNR